MFSHDFFVELAQRVISSAPLRRHHRLNQINRKKIPASNDARFETLEPRQLFNGYDVTIGAFQQGSAADKDTGSGSLHQKVTGAGITSPELALRAALTQASVSIVATDTSAGRTSTYSGTGVVNTGGGGTSNLKLTSAAQTGTPGSPTSPPLTSFGLTGSQLVLAFEDGADTDYNDAFFLVTIVPVQTNCLVCMVGSAGGSSESSGQSNNSASDAGDGGVALGTGAVSSSSTELSSSGFGAGWGQSLGFSSDPSQLLPGGAGGNTMSPNQLPHLAQAGTGIQIVQTSASSLWFDNASGTFTPELYSQDKLVESGSGSSDQFLWTDTNGGKTVLYGFNSAIAANLRGKFKSFTDPAGNVRSVKSVDSNGNPAEIISVQGTGTSARIESYTYTNFATGVNVGKLMTVAYRRGTGDPTDPTYPSNVTWGATPRQVAYTYYGTADSNGSLNDLQTATVQDGSGNPIDTEYYRWYAPQSTTSFSVGTPSAGAVAVTVTVPSNSFAVGDAVVITGATDYRLNGTFAITAVTGTTFTYSAQGFGSVALNPGGTLTFVAKGYVGGLKSYFDPASYARLAAIYSTASTATDAQVAPYATKYFEYDASQRVTKTIIQGIGCTTCASGLGTYTYAYTVNPSGTYADDYNTWRTKTVEGLDDGNTRTVYTNFAGQTMLDITTDTTTSAKWINYYRYDSSGREVLHAQPSAVTGFSDSLSDLIGYNTGTGSATYLNASSGLIALTIYGTSTTAMSSTAGNVIGYVSQTQIKQGTGGTPIVQMAYLYFSHADAAGAVIYPVASQTQYKDTAGTQAETTTYSYTWLKDVASNDTNQMATVRTFLPGVAATQNGPGSGVGTTTFFDSLGRVTWMRDEDQFLSYIGYSQDTGAVVTQITDVDTAHTPADFGTIPIDPATGVALVSPSGTRLHLKTLTTVDSLGRPLSVTDPKGNVTYTVYNDTAHEVRTYAGWNSTTHQPTGPTQISREFRPAGGSAGLDYMETLTTSATPALNGSNLPAGTETYDGTNILSISRTITNNAAQPVWTDSFFSLSGLTGSWHNEGVTLSSGVPTELGTVGTNYYRTETDLGPRGWTKRAVNALGTITRYLYDARGNELSTWVGTDDTPTSGVWSPTNTAGTDLTEVMSNIYDAGLSTGGGDGNLTSTTQYPNSSSSRTSQTAYDWRDRPIATKSGITGGTEATSDNTHPITFATLDNLGEQTAMTTYDGDTLGIYATGDTLGYVGSAPGTGAQTDYSESSFDDQGRVYESRQFSVDPATGAISSNSLKTDNWYDRRGNVIKTSQPGGLVSKSKLDGAGRVIAEYETDGGGDHDGTFSCTWSDAGNETGDAVMEQTEYLYDADGNVTLTTNKERFHDETTTGILGNATTAPLARVSYAAEFYDAANRLTDSASVGTNGGTSYSLPGSVPTRSSTVLVNSTGYAADEVQSVTISGAPTGGTFTLTLAGSTTTALAFNASSAAVQSALQTLTSIGSGNVIVLGGSGGPYTVRFAGAKAGQNLLQMTATSSLTGGTSPTVSVGTTSQGGDNGLAQTMTDPRGLISKSDDDLLGRTLRTTANFVDFNASDADDQQTAYTYDGLSHVTGMTAVMPTGTPSQTTQYVYGVTAAGGSGLTSYDLLKEVDYPNKTTGAPNTSDKESYLYDALGEPTQYTDRNGNVHGYLYDSLGRQTKDTVSTLGSGVDGSVRRVETGYNAQGLPFDFTQYSATTGGTVVNEVQDVYNGLDQLTSEYQATAGAVNTSTSPKVQYAYTLMASGVNNSRLTSMTYPNGRIVRTEYNTGLDANISRPSFIADGTLLVIGTHLEEYQYLGLGTVVARNHPEPGLNLTYISPTGGTADAGDKYVGLDRFGRVADQNWVNVRDTSTSSDDFSTDRDQYTYDADSNRVTKQWSANSTIGGLDEAYSYDGLNRLTKVNRGTLVSGAISDANATSSQRWDGSSDGTSTSGLDALGNWKGVYNDADGGVGAGAAVVTRHTSNSQNQITSISGGTTTLTYDPAGNMTTDETGDKYTYDAWNRTKAVKTSAGTVKVTYTIDPLGRRVSQAVNAGVGTGDSADLYYSANWQVVEERAVGGSTATHQNVWSGVYVDALVERDNAATVATAALDTSFGSSGKQIVNVGATDDDQRQVLQSDGKLVAVGSSGGNVALTRLLPNGSLDTTGFGTGGIVTTDFGTSGDKATDVYIQDDGKIVIVGITTGSNVIAARYLANGTLDSTFGTSGKYVKDFGGDEQGAGVTEDSQGRIIIVGYKAADALVMRLTAAGVLDTANFNAGGAFPGCQVFDAGYSNTDRLYDAQLQPDGKILVSGETFGSGNKVLLGRINDNGTMDSGFGTSGIVTTDFGGGGDRARRVRVQQDGKIVIGGTGGLNDDYLVARYSAAGVLDTSFGSSSGFTLVDFGATEVGDEMKLDNQGRIVMAGTGNGDFGVARFTKDGILDTSFNTTGKLTIDINSGSTDLAKGLDVLQDGRIVIGGNTTTGTNTDFAFAVIGGGDTRHYVMQDANYNVTAVADATGKIIDRDLYSAYGDQTVLNADGTVDPDNMAEANMPFGYQGLRKDVNSGNWNARNRDDRSPLGTFTQADPSGYPDGGNRYELERNNPIVDNDPNGLAAITPAGVYPFGIPIQNVIPGDFGSWLVRGKSIATPAPGLLINIHYKPNSNIQLKCSVIDIIQFTTVSDTDPISGSISYPDPSDDGNHIRGARSLSGLTNRYGWAVDAPFHNPYIGYASASSPYLTSNPATPGNYPWVPGVAGVTDAYISDTPSVVPGTTDIMDYHFLDIAIVTAGALLGKPLDAIEWGFQYRPPGFIFPPSGWNPATIARPAARSSPDMLDAINNWDKEFPNAKVVPFNPFI